jgi:creatinine amidohydrolase
MRMLKLLLAGMVASVVSGSAVSAQDRPHRRDDAGRRPANLHTLEELSWPEIDRLDRERTLWVLPVGMIEEHGPHLPVGADTLGVTYEAQAAAVRVARALPDWHILMMPAIGYGHGGANLIGNRRVHPGTYSIRQSTLRSLVIDVGSQVALNGFRWIAVLNGHAAPTHDLAITEACDFVSETFGVTMLNLTGLFRADAAIQAQGRRMQARHFTAEELASFGLDVHAGVAETSGMLAVRPDLVRDTYRTLPSRAGRSLQELREIAAAPGWQGYFSAPANATAAHGRAVEDWWIDGFTDLMLRALRGEDMRGNPRAPEALPPALAPALEQVLADEAALGARLEKWLAGRATR